MNNFSQPLPYSITHIQTQPIMLNPGNLHFQIQLPVSQAIQGYLGLIGTCSIEAIQARNQESPLRLFVYNWLSTNQYQNNDFLSFVKVVCQFVEMTMGRGTHKNYVEAIYDGAGKVTEMYCAQCVQAFPALLQAIDASTAQRVQSMLGTIQDFTNALNQFQNQNAFNRPQLNSLGGQYPTQQPMQQNVSMGSIFPSSSTSTSIFSNAAPMAQVVQNNVSEKVFLTAPAKVEQAPVAVPTSTPAPSIEYLSASDDNVKWLPSEKFPYNYAFDSTKHKMYYKATPDGKLKPVIQPLTEAEIMDQSKHFIPTVSPASLITFGKTGEADNFLTGMKNDTAIMSTAQDQMTLDNMIQKVEGVDVSTKEDTYFSSLCDDEVWKDCMICLLSRRNVNSRVYAYATSSYMLSALVTNGDPTLFANKLASCDNFITVVAFLKDLKAGITLGLGNKDDSIILNYFNIHLTKRLNRFLQYQLGLGMSVGSFIEDAVEILDYISVKYGDKFANPLRVNQKNIIEDVTTFAQGEFAKDLAPEEEHEDSIDKSSAPLHITHFYCTDYFLAVNLFSHELKVDIPKQSKSVAVHEEITPICYQIAKFIYAEEAQAAPNKFRRHLMRTLDGVVFEFNRSVIDPEVFLISLYK